jgi:uncharacterized protein YpmB
MNPIERQKKIDLVIKISIIIFIILAIAAALFFFMAAKDVGQAIFIN